MIREKIHQWVKALAPTLVDWLLTVRDRVFDQVSAIPFAVSPNGRLSPRFVAVTVLVVGILLTQFVASLQKQGDTRVASAHGGVLGVTSEKIPLARDPNILIDRFEVHHAPAVALTKDEAFVALGLEVHEEDIVTFVPDPILGFGSTITIARATPVTLDNGGSRLYTRTQVKTVKEFLDEQGVALGEKDTVDPAPDSDLWWGGRVIVTRVEEGEFTALEDIRYDVETREDANKFKDEVRVIREGKRGKKEVTAFIRRENGNVVEKKILAEKMLSKPVTRIEVRGAKHRPTTGRWEDLINEIAPKYWADPSGLTKIMMCESGGNLTSYNPAGPYYGMFQFDEYTFTQIAGHSMSEIEDARAQIDGAAKLYSARYWHWPVCSKGT